MTHVSLHRCRFVDYPPSSITSIAFSHSSAPHSALPPPKTLRVAIGRNNGSIEIWNPLSGKWHHETTLQGGSNRSIEGLAWTQDYDEDGRGQLRLLSIGYSSAVTEWDLATGRPAKHLDCNGGVIWSLSVQPRRNAADVPEEERDDDEALAQKVVVGTDDGTLKLLSTAGGRGQLTFIKNLTRAGTAKARVLSLVWKDRNTVVAGMADSTIRVWDIRSGRNIARMSLNRERGKEVLVWAVKVTKNGDVVSGDSRGEVCFWNGLNWTLKQRMKAHEADCLTLEVGGQNGESVITGGADMRTVLYKMVGKGRGWGEVARRRFHKHDVRAMAAYESGAFSVVVSGGVDMTPIIIPFRGFTTENHRTLPLVPQNPIVTTIPDRRILMSYWEREVKIWHIEELSEIMPADLHLDDESQGRKLLSRIVLGNEEYITSAALSPLPNSAGYLLAVSTIGEVKLFSLRNPKRLGSGVLRVQQITIPKELPVKSIEPESDSEDSDDDDDDDDDEVELAKEGARHLQFTPDGKRLLIITPDSRVLIANLDIILPQDRKEKPNITISSPLYELDRELPSFRVHHGSKALQPSKKKSRQRQDEGTHAAYINTIVKANFSSTSRLLAVGDLAGNIATFILSPSEGSWTRITTSIPRLPAAPVVLSFRPAPSTLQISGTEDDEDEAPDAELLVLPADTHIIHLFSATSGRLTRWSQQNPMPDCLPVEFAAVGDRAIGAFWEGTDRAWCFGAAWVWMFDFSREWPNHKLSFDTIGHGDGKRKRGAPVGVGSISGAGSRMITPMGLKQAPQIPEDESDAEEEYPISDDASEEEEEEGEEEGEELGEEKAMIRKQKGQKPYWGSYRYRSILGFLPVGKREVVEMAGEGWEGGLNAVEVVVVERPVWDVGLPPRSYDGKG